MNDREKIEWEIDNRLFVDLLAIADTYEEEGNQGMADAYRYLQKNRKFPSIHGTVFGATIVWEFRVKSNSPAGPDDLPEPVGSRTSAIPNLTKWEDARRRFGLTASKTISEAYRRAAEYLSDRKERLDALAAAAHPVAG